MSVVLPTPLGPERTTSGSASGTSGLAAVPLGSGLASDGYGGGDASDIIVAESSDAAAAFCVRTWENVEARSRALLVHYSTF